MSTVTIRRTIRPSTRQEKSPYRIKLDNLGIKDTLVVEVDHENDPGFFRAFKFKPGALKAKKSVHFVVNGDEIFWLAGVVPDNTIFSK